MLFVGHGNPMYAIEPNRYADAWRGLASAIPKPAAVLVISAHWYTRGIRVTAMRSPRTIHDFGGFPEELYAVRYPAPGSPELASRVAELLAPREVTADTAWGLDHGAWAVLRHMYPDAAVPVVQLSIDRRLAAADHAAIGAALAPLRDDGVLIVGSGNAVHNLGLISWQPQAPPQPWAAGFESVIRRLCEDRDLAALSDYAAISANAALAVPTPEHYLPLLYVLGATSDGETVRFPVEGIDAGSISMLSVLAG